MVYMNITPPYKGFGSGEQYYVTIKVYFIIQIDGALDMSLELFVIICNAVC